MAHERINPWPWSTALGYSQAVREAPGARRLHVSGQCALDAEGRPQHPGDMRGQVALAMANLGAVLAAAGMGWQDVVMVRILSTDVDATLAAMDLIVPPLAGPAGPPAMTLMGVARLALPPLMVEIEATAAA
jgi:enamine deaminase RidA (YjgF/YER057c/UK114 family)